jgi:hypothetical protein
MKTLEKLRLNPQDKMLYDLFYKEGWENFLDFIKNLKKSDIEKKGIEWDKILEMKKFIEKYIKNSFKPLSKEQYDLIFLDLPW